MAMIKWIEQAYSGFAPRHQCRGVFLNLHIPTMGSMGGVTLYLARAHLQRNNCELMRNTIDDYARFVNTLFAQLPKYIYTTNLASQILCISISSKTRVHQQAQSRTASCTIHIQTQTTSPASFSATSDSLVPQLPTL
ncbi:hypothetical protein GGR57DRAFT_477354 [Xylariaceae sp. FL1272]|nr:hypothetical protein GGR57DRAFT_477354 [Xylariaceae sp. FL1272]